MCVCIHAGMYICISAPPLIPLIWRRACVFLSVRFVRTFQVSTSTHDFETQKFLAFLRILQATRQELFKTRVCFKQFCMKQVLCDFSSICLLLLSCTRISADCCLFYFSPELSLSCSFLFFAVLQVLQKPISKRNEVLSLMQLEREMSRLLLSLPTTIEEDSKLLGSRSLRLNQRNCVLMRLKTKLVFQHLRVH